MRYSLYRCISYAYVFSAIKRLKKRFLNITKSTPNMSNCAYYKRNNYLINDIYKYGKEIICNYVIDLVINQIIHRKFIN